MPGLINKKLVIEIQLVLNNCIFIELKPFTMRSILLFLFVLQCTMINAQELVEREWMAELPLALTGLERTETGEIYASSTIYSVSPDTAAAIAIKFNSNLELEWARQLRVFNDDDLVTVKVLADGSILYGGGLGAFFSPLLGGSLYKLDADGNVLWAKVYPGSDDDRISQIFELPNGDLLLANRRSVNGQPTLFLHTDPDGNILNQFILEYEDQALEPTSITFDGTTFYALSRVLNDAFEAVMLFTAFSLEEVIWSKALNPGQDITGGVLYPKPGGGFSVRSQVVDPESVFNGLDVWLFETDATGNPGWSKRIFRPNNGFTELGSGLIHLPDGQLLVSYRFQTESGFVPVFSRFNDQGELSWIRQSLGSSMGYLTLLNDELVLMAGPSVNGGVGLGTSTIDAITACGTTEINVEVNELSITSTDVNVVFGDSDIEEDVPEFNSIDLSFDLLELCSATLGLENETKSDFKIYPNPTRNEFSIDGLTQKARIVLRDISGRVIMSEMISPAKNQIELNHLSSGMYLISIDGVFEGRINFQP